MQKARYLLDNTPDMTILDVAKCCGYDGQSSFTRAFKRFFGVTPSDYLAKLILTLILFTASIAVGAAPTISLKASRRSIVRRPCASMRPVAVTMKNNFTTVPSS